MDLGTPHGLSVSSEESFGNVEFPTEIDRSRRQWSLGFQKKLRGPDWGRGVWGRRYGSGGRSYGSVWTHRDTYGPPWGPLGAHGGPFPFFPIFGFGPWPRSLESFRGGPCEQPIPIEQNRNCHNIMWFPKRCPPTFSTEVRPRSGSPSVNNTWGLCWESQTTDFLSADTADVLPACTADG